MVANVGLAGLKRIVGGNHRRIPRELFAKAVPTRNEHVREVDWEGGLRLVAPLASQGRGFLGAIAKWARMPDTKEFELEEVGAFVWSLCDGKATTEGIARRLRERFKMNRLEADASLAAFLEMLAQRRLITLTIPQKAKKR